MKNNFIFFLLLLSASCYCQSDVIINTTTLYIAGGKYDEAEKYLDSLIHIDPNSIDAMMMKGNVMLNRSMMQTSAMDLITIDDESIYSENLANLQAPVVLIPRSEALKIESIWKRCIQVDSARLDIREGLCTLYGMADMRKELLAYLPVTARAGKIKGNEFVNVLVQYAQLLSERNDKDGAYEAYKKIAQLYPDVTGIWCLLAEAYQNNGNLTEARRYADKALAVAKPDIAMCSDALDIYTALGDYDKELAALKLATYDSVFKDFPFYNGIYEYSNHNNHWREELQKYINQFTMPPDSNVMYSAATFMLSKYFNEDYDGFVSLLHYSVSDLYVGIIAERGMYDFKDSIQPYLIATQVLIHDRNYSKADSIFALLDNKIKDDNTRTDYQLQYAFCLYCAGQYSKSIVLWSGLNKMQSPFLFAASNYFLGSCYLKSGDRNGALPYFQALISSNDETKYAYLAKLQVDKLR